LDNFNNISSITNIVVAVITIIIIVMMAHNGQGILHRHQLPVSFWSPILGESLKPGLNGGQS
jgi:hypothetical protein